MKKDTSKTVKDKQTETIQREDKILYIIQTNPGIHRSRIERLASSKSDKIRMNGKTASKMVDKLKNAGRIRSRRSGKRDCFYLPVDYYLDDQLEKLFEDLISNLQDNVKKSIHILKNEIFKTNYSGKNYIKGTLEKLCFYVEPKKIEFSSYFYQNCDLNMDDLLKELGEYCSKHSDEKANRLLKDALHMNELIQENKKRTIDIKEKLVSVKNGKERYESTLDFLHEKELEDDFYKKLVEINQVAYEMMHSQPTRDVNLLFKPYDDFN